MYSEPLSTVSSLAVINSIATADNIAMLMLNGMSYTLIGPPTYEPAPAWGVFLLKGFS